MPEILKGEKIYLKEGLREEDYPVILRGYKNLEVINYVSFAIETIKFKTIEEAKKFTLEVDNQIIFGIYTYENIFIGYATLSEFDGKDECEFAIFILDQNYWGRGIGLEATELIIDYAFEKLGIRKIVLYVSEYHERAIKLYEKVGFKKKKFIPDDREIFKDGGWLLSGTVLMEIKNKNLKKKLSNSLI